MNQTVSMTKRHRFLTLFSLILVFSLFFVVITDVPVFAYTLKIVDNDDAQGNHNASYGFDTYLYNGYLGDSRIQQSTSTSLYYRYIYDEAVYRVGQFTLYFNAYLNNLDFTDPSASYRFIYGGDEGGHVTWILNQYYAPATWATNYYGPFIIGSGQSLNYFSPYAEVHCSIHPNCNTGADGIKVKFY